MAMIGKPSEPARHDREIGEYGVRLSLGCFVCGESLGSDRRVHVALPPSCGYPAIHLHDGCAVDLAAELLAAVRSDGAGVDVRVRVASGHAAGLTTAELEVLAGIIRGDTNRQIGRRLGRTQRGVSRTVSDTLIKLDARSRTEAAIKALMAGIVELDDGKAPQ